MQNTQPNPSGREARLLAKIARYNATLQKQADGLLHHRNKEQRMLNRQVSVIGRAVLNSPKLRAQLLADEELAPLVKKFDAVALSPEKIDAALQKR